MSFRSNDEMVKNDSVYEKVQRRTLHKSKCLSNVYFSVFCVCLSDQQPREDAYNYFYMKHMSDCVCTCVYIARSV